MNWLRRLALLLLWCQVLNASAAEPDLLASVSHQLTSFEQLSGRFEQQKTLPFLQNPLKSSGDYSISGEQGLLWRVTSPLVSEMTVDSAGVKLDGREFDDRGTGELMAKIMQSFMAGDLSAIADTFVISGEQCPQFWVLDLKPRSLILGAVLENIEVRGDTLLRQVIITEENKTETLIRFLAVTPEDAAASGREVSSAHANSP